MGMIIGIKKGLLFFLIITVMVIQISWLNEDFCMAAAKGSTVISEDNKEADVKIRAVWNAMKAALRVGDANKALRYFSPLSTSEYKEIFNILAGDDLRAAANEMGDIKMVYINEDFAKYEIEKDEAIDGKVHKITYSITFVRLSDGNWYIDDL